MRSAAASSLLFALVVLACLAQVAWWTIFHWQETARLTAAGQALAARDTDAALRALGARAGHDLAAEAHRRFVMFASEGAVLGLLVALGIVFFYLALLRERRLRAAHERFLTGATHALRTPLATLRLGLESMQQGRTPDEKRARYLGAMLVEVDRLDRDVQNVLAAARVNRPRAELHAEVGDLRLDVERAIETMRARAEAASVTIASDLTTVPVSRDAAALQLMLHNLLDNAIKYSHASGTVHVGLRAERDAAVLRIADSGAGMTHDELAEVFRRFYRGTGKPHVGGTGLGLYLTRELVRAHGGTIEARSEGKERGSEFVVRLPRAGSAT